MTGNNIYWVSTGLLTLLYLASAVLYVAKSESVRKTIIDFGYPGYLLQILVGVKLLFILVVLTRFNVALSDLAYAGALFHLLLSAAAHIGIRKPIAAIPAFVGLVLLVVSFITQNTARTPPSPYALEPMASSVPSLT
ncbi:hypothetical protein Cthiooxydans_46940 [Comamonas thiooxydans]|nr:hypothetical protein Cthiooxydans_46940 [Comamonas thiooxydans]